MKRYSLLTSKKILLIILSFLLLATPHMHPTPAYAETPEYMCQIKSNPVNTGLSYYPNDNKFYQTDDPTKNPSNLSQEIGPVDVTAYVKGAYGRTNQVDNLRIDWGDGAADVLPSTEVDCSEYNPEWNFTLRVWPEFTMSRTIACHSSTGGDPDYFNLQMLHDNSLNPEFNKIHDKVFRMNGCLGDPTPTPDEPTPTPEVNQPPVVRAGPDTEGFVNEFIKLTHPLIRVIDDGLPNPPAAVTTKWEVIEAPAGSTVQFVDVNAVKTSAKFSTIGRYVLRLTGDDSELQSSDTVVVVVLNNVDHYEVEFKAWIPHDTVVDPLLITAFNSPNRNYPLMGEPLKSCFAAAADNQLTGNTRVLISQFKGDDHDDYGEVNGPKDYRIVSRISFDYDGTRITNFQQSGDYGQTERILSIRTDDNIVARCIQQATEDIAALPESTQTGDTSFSIDVSGANPLMPETAGELGALSPLICNGVTGSILCPIILDPKIDGHIDGTIGADGALTFTYATDFFPSYGIAVKKNDELVTNRIINDASCVNAQSYTGAANVLVRLQTTFGLPRNTGTVTANSADKPCNPNARGNYARAITPALLPINPITEPLLLIIVSQLE